MLKNISKLEVEIENRIYQLLCDNDSPLQHVKGALFQFQKYIGHIEDQAKAQAEAIKVEENPNSDISPEQPQEQECTQQE